MPFGSLQVYLILRKLYLSVDKLIVHLTAALVSEHIAQIATGVFPVQKKKNRDPRWITYYVYAD